MFTVDEWLIPADMYYFTLSYKAELSPVDCSARYGTNKIALMTKDNFLKLFNDAVEHNLAQIRPQLQVGDFVKYKGQKGRVKELVSSLLVRVVYHCNNEWDNYQDYTAALTPINQLEKL